MNKLLFVLISLAGCFASADTITCEAIDESTTNKVIISHTRFQIETIDLVKESGTQRIYSRTYADPSNRGGYVVSSCSPDENEITGVDMRARARCGIANSSDSVLFTFRLNKDRTNGYISIYYSGYEVVTKDFRLQSCK